MKFAIRQEVGIDNYATRLLRVKDIPLELALPYKLDDYIDQSGAGLFDFLTLHIRGNGDIIQSVHATQGHLTDPGFMKWGLETVRFAESVGAKVVVFHPENAKKDRRLDVQVLAIRNIKRLQREVPNITVAVETFGGPKRVLFPEEIGDLGLPMVLDTSHLFPERTTNIIERYHKGIVAVHLSEARDGRQHMPVEDFGFEVLDKLKAKGWNGCVALEYLPEFHDRMAPDREMLKNLYGGKE